MLTLHSNFCNRQSNRLNNDNNYYINNNHITNDDKYINNHCNSNNKIDSDNSNKTNNTSVDSLNNHDLNDSETPFNIDSNNITNKDYNRDTTFSCNTHDNKTT